MRPACPIPSRPIPTPSTNSQPPAARASSKSIDWSSSKGELTVTDYAKDSDRRKQKALERLGTNEPRCGDCPETDWRCLECHHVAGRALDGFTVILCAN